MTRVTTSTKNMIPFHITFCPLPLKGKRHSSGKSATNLNAAACISSLPKFPNLDDEVAVSHSRIPSLKLRPKTTYHSARKTKHITSSFRFANTSSPVKFNARFVAPISNTTATTTTPMEDQQTTQEERDCDSLSSNQMVINTSLLRRNDTEHTTTIGDVRMHVHYVTPSRLKLKPRFKNNTRKSSPPTDQEDRANMELPFLF